MIELFPSKCITQYFVKSFLFWNSTERVATFNVSSNMNRTTRRLSKIPDEVREELSPWFIEKQAINEDSHEKIVKLNKEAEYMISDLKVQVHIFLLHLQFLIKTHKH